jgi:hypothetical protein
MGTNYYWHPGGVRRDEVLGQETPNLHVGKSSAGWTFSLRIHPDQDINTLDDWRARWATGVIFDEYDHPVTAAEMEAIVTDRAHPKGLRSHVGLTDAQGLWRSSARYGGPTWDLCDDEFS